MAHARASENAAPNQHWMVEKRVNVAFIVALILQTIALIASGTMVVARFDARGTALEVTDIRLVSERDARRKTVDDRFEFLARDRDRLIRVETKTEGIEKAVGRIETKIDTLAK